MKYVMHAQVTVTAPETEPALTNMQYSAPEDPVVGAGSSRSARGRPRHPRSASSQPAAVASPRRPSPRSTPPS